MSQVVLRKFTFEPRWYGSPPVVAFSSIAPRCRYTEVEGIMLALALQTTYPNCVTAVVKHFDPDRERKAADILYNIYRDTVIAADTSGVWEMDNDLVLFILHPRDTTFGDNPKITYTLEQVVIEPRNWSIPARPYG